MSAAVRAPVSITVERAKQIMAQAEFLRREVEAGDELVAAANTIVSDAQVILSLSQRCDELEREVEETRTQIKACEQENADLREDLRAACGVRS